LGRDAGAGGPRCVAARTRHDARRFVGKSRETPRIDAADGLGRGKRGVEVVALA